MKLVIDPAPDTLSTEDLNTHFSALGECSISRSVNSTQPPRVTVSYSDFTAALQKLLTLHFSPLLRTSRLDFKLDCSIDISVKSQAEGPRSRSRSPRRCDGDTAEEDKAEEAPAKTDAANSSRAKPQEPPKEESKEPPVEKKEEVKAEKKEEVKAEKKEEVKAERKEEQRKKKRDKNAPKKNIHVESDGSHFQILRKYKNDENTQLHCLSCKRKVLKRSVSSHVATNTHKRNYSRQLINSAEMSRPTIFSQDAGKTLTGNDLPQRHKSILHLVTEPNFLTNDLDFSQSRPFTAKPRLRPSRTSISTVMHHLARDQVPLTWDQSPARKRAFPQSSQNLSSSFDLGWTRPSQETESPRKALSKQAEDMIQGKLLLRADLPPPQQRVSKAKQERVGLYMNSHLMQSAMRQRGVAAKK